MTRLVITTSVVTVVCGAILMVSQSPVALLLQALPLGMMVVTFRKIPIELRRRVSRDLRFELWFGGFVCTGLLAMAVLGSFVPYHLRRAVALFWLVVPLAFLGVLVIRIVRSIATRVNRNLT
jgi:uncharacterized membrane protein AbrB (regulator of aidB expression)